MTDDKSQRLIELAKMSLEGIDASNRFSDQTSRRATERAQRAEAQIAEALGTAVELKTRLQQERARFEADCGDRTSEIDRRERAVAEREKYAEAEIAALLKSRLELETLLARVASALA
jgi:hypothetical protein